MFELHIMTRDDLIQKWLNHDLNSEELLAFKQLEDYDDLTRLDTYLKDFKADSMDVDHALETTWKSIHSKSKRWTKYIATASKIAAVFVICLGIYFYTTTLDDTINTIAAQQKTVLLPDASEVNLNALTTITYNASQWSDNRSLHLSGEAFFKVSKGQKFDVSTDSGIVSVLGTQFNVKQRDNYFEVTCYEGKVRVTTHLKQEVLLAGDSFLMIDGTLFNTEKNTVSSPSWLNHNSMFKSIPYREVIAEFERQYNVSITLENIDDSQQFTGSFTHNDIKIALKSITLPLQLKFSKTDNVISLKRE